MEREGGVKDAAAAMVSARINSLSAWMAARRSKNKEEEEDDGVRGVSWSVESGESSGSDLDVWRSE